jgi:hypothetical protein
VATQFRHRRPPGQDFLAAPERAHAGVPDLPHAEVGEEALGGLDLRRLLVHLDHRGTGHDVAVDEALEIPDRPGVARCVLGDGGMHVGPVGVHRRREPDPGASGEARLYAAYHLIALRGLRRGEACGLRWWDLDLDGGVATINQQLQQYDGHIVVGPPKTARSVRTIALDRTTIAALRRHRQRQERERAEMGESYQDSD